VQNIDLKKKTDTSYTTIVPRKYKR